MKRLYTLQLVPGMTVAEDILSFNQQLVMQKGTVLTDKLITRLELYGILTASVEDPDTAQSSLPGASSPKKPSNLERIKASPDFAQFKKEYQSELSAFRCVINDIVEKNMKLDIDTFFAHSLAFVRENAGQTSILDMLQCMRDYDDPTFSHSMNVALMSHMLAGWLKFDAEETRTAAICGLLHDIGKLLTPHDILAKPGRLTDEEYGQIQKHPVSGYQMLLTQNVDDHVRRTALMHHERCDGSGYPMHLQKDQIDKYARIVAITDVYDAMTAERVYRGPLCPFRVIEIFEAEGFQKYDVQYLLTFLEHVVNTYIQNRCRLSDGREGEIIFINKQKLSRPVVHCGQDYINLADHPRLCITDLL